ncbi:MbnP family protein [Flavobacterium marginilacus]|uniref:MbnP family protein n=1 Tax=Flavobacterium marginilacus TaxID=3003256 RepID=UPI00248F281F|nr:MbnP family protein [Flavobacterium marginilacus]
MKFQIKKIIAVVAIAFALGSCSNNDDEAIGGEGKLGVEFDNVFGSSNLILNTQSNVTSQGETLKISDVKYIISNIVLTKEDGTTFTYPKSKSYFVVSEADTETQEIELENIPAGDYTKIKFGIGVDKAQFDLGATGQGDFLTIADEAGMMWSWSAGYKFVLFEGKFTSSTVTAETAFMVHTGQTGTDYNYTEVTLNLPTKALVRTTITPDIHIFADVAKIIDGTNKIKLSDNNMGGMGAMIMGGTNLPLITANLSNMFTVNHVHND